jgi:hypothetical protein
MAGTIGLAIIIAGTPERVLRATSFVPIGDPMDVRISVLAICFLIFLRHIEPIRELMANGDGESSED